MEPWTSDLKEFFKKKSKEISYWFCYHFIFISNEDPFVIFKMRHHGVEEW